jgi:hypothetical protein
LVYYFPDGARHPRPSTCRERGQVDRPINLSYLVFVGLRRFSWIHYLLLGATGSPSKGTLCTAPSARLLHLGTLILFQEKSKSLFRKCEQVLDAVNVHTFLRSSQLIYPIRRDFSAGPRITKFLQVTLITACYRTLSSWVISASFHHFFRSLTYISSEP